MTPRKQQALRAIAVILVAFISLIIINPLRLPEPLLRLYILHATPMDSSFENVLNTIKARGWEVAHTDKSRGFHDQRIDAQSTRIGVMSIRASLGDYQGIPLSCNVTVYWGFNEEGKLIDIWVWKTWDGL